MNDGPHTPTPSPSVAISGASGLVGRRVRARLTTAGWRVLRLVRTQSDAEDEVYWNPATREFSAADLEGVDAVVHLAGESVAAGRWNAHRKTAILDSRVVGTTLLCEGLAQLSRPPRMLIAASAIGYYGDRGDEWLTEESHSGDGFLAEVTRAWETATQPATHTGIRVVNLRIGMVLARDGGALARMLTPFKLGLGGRIGHGRQFMSWIALADLTAAIEYLLGADDIAGAVNAVAPSPVTNAEFTATLGRVLHRPTRCPLPAPAVRLLFGQMGRELLLGSARVSPELLTTSGFAFTYPQLEDALCAELALTK